MTVTAVRGPVKKQVVNSNRSGPSSLLTIEKAIDDLGTMTGAWAAGEEMP